MDEQQQEVKSNEPLEAIESRPLVRLLLTESKTVELFNKRSCCIVLMSEDEDEHKPETTSKPTRWEDRIYQSNKSTQTYYSNCFRVFKHKST